MAAVYYGMRQSAMKSEVARFFRGNFDGEVRAGLGRKVFAIRFSFRNRLKCLVFRITNAAFRERNTRRGGFFKLSLRRQLRTFAQTFRQKKIRLREKLLVPEVRRKFGTRVRLKRRRARNRTQRTRAAGARVAEFAHSN